MVDVAVKAEAAWVCQAEGHHLADILLPVHLSNRDDNEEELSPSDREETDW